MYPWSYTQRKNINNRLFKSIGLSISKINNYKVVKGSRFIPNVGNSNDWLYGKHGILAYTVELGKSHAPTEEEVILQICKTHIGVNLLICEMSSKIDIYGHESDWSDPLAISMPKNKAINPFLLFLERLIERFPILEQILQPVYDKLTDL